MRPFPFAPVVAPVAVLMAALVAAPAVSQDLPSMRDASALVFAEDGAVEWEVIPDPALSEADLATLDQINRVQPQPYYAALAIAPDAGLASEMTALAANYHDEANARTAALDACEARRDEQGAPCIVALVIRPEGWEPGRPLQLSSQATAALRDEYRALPRRNRAMAISPSTGQWAVGEGRPAAIEACGAPDCVVVVEG
ncbi:5-aminolevulic acid synthase [Roseibacterium sp. SDUM158017]|uniref:5-aminolevulic acid synthase n=1 Tax=Roseicyclus salinarum TaxID=3036773 RepID=UPI00241584B3|nr:5-aminolevulic acid synthase [Roseibacterium sp. SDUM158017]MDG4647604.1 5-aminolevulic acid synthase [Roseibacterium sp. SDUM158017]